MTIGMILYLVAAVLFLLAAIGSTIVPNPTTWGLFCVALGLFLHDYDLYFRRRR